MCVCVYVGSYTSSCVYTYLLTGGGSKVVCTVRRSRQRTIRRITRTGRVYIYNAHIYMCVCVLRGYSFSLSRAENFAKGPYIYTGRCRVIKPLPLPPPSSGPPALITLRVYPFAARVCIPIVGGNTTVGCI